MTISGLGVINSLQLTTLQREPKKVSENKQRIYREQPDVVYSTGGDELAPLIPLPKETQKKQNSNAVAKSTPKPAAQKPNPFAAQKLKEGDGETDTTTPLPALKTDVYDDVPPTTVASNEEWANPFGNFAQELVTNANNIDLNDALGGAA